MKRHHDEHMANLGSEMGTRPEDTNAEGYFDGQPHHQRDGLGTHHHHVPDPSSHRPHGQSQQEGLNGGGLKA